MTGPRIARSERKPRRPKLTSAERAAIVKLYSVHTAQELAEMFNTTPPTIYDLVRGKLKTKKSPQPKIAARKPTASCNHAWQPTSNTPSESTRAAELAARKKRIAAQRAANRNKIEECLRMGRNPFGSHARTVHSW